MLEIYDDKHQNESLTLIDDIRSHIQTEMENSSESSNFEIGQKIAMMVIEKSMDYNEWLNIVIYKCVILLNLDK